MAPNKDKDKKKRSDSETPDESSEPVVRDRRKIDPETGEARLNSEDGDSEVDGAREVNETGETISDDDIAKLLEGAQAPSDSESEHLNDLKRVQAEYANYRKRVDRDRFLARELAIAEVMTGMLPVLDDLDLAQAHGDLEGSPLALVSQKIRASFERYGLTKIGEVGEAFDPKFHEAIARLPNQNVTVETIADVVSPGYQLGERLLRAAKVAVNVPEG